MAEGTKLVLTFDANGDKTATFTFNYAKPSATTAQVKALMNAMIANKEIYENQPVTAKSAKAITTSETVYDLAA